MSLKYRRKDGGTIAFSSSAASLFEEHRQTGTKLESGGILLGRWISGTEDVIVDRATEPSGEDRRGKFSFWRAKRPAQMLVNRAWVESDATIWYLGEWHSHPEDHPSPSSNDLADWLRILAKARYEQSFLIFIIVGRKTTRVWEGTKEQQLVTALDPIMAP